MAPTLQHKHSPVALRPAPSRALVVPRRRREWPGPFGDLSAGLVLLSVTRLPNGCQVRGDLSRGPPLCTALGVSGFWCECHIEFQPRGCSVVQPSTWLGNSVLKSATLVSTPTLSATQGALPAPGSPPEALRPCETARPSLLSSEHQTWQDSFRLLEGEGQGRVCSPSPHPAPMTRPYSLVRTCVGLCPQPASWSGAERPEGSWGCEGIWAQP